MRCCRCVTPLLQCSIPAFPNLISKSGSPSWALERSRAPPFEMFLRDSSVCPPKTAALIQSWIPLQESILSGRVIVVSHKLLGGTRSTNSLALRVMLALSWRLKTRLAPWHAASWRERSCLMFADEERERIHQLPAGENPKIFIMIKIRFPLR